VELLLIRHALPVRQEVIEGVADPELSPDGLRQSECLATYLASEKIDTLYTSPLLRARETAMPLAAHQRLEPIVRDGLAEYDRHAAEYVPVEELKAAGDPRWLLLLAGELEGEVDVDEFRATVVDTIEAIIAENPSRKVAAVCHGGVINDFLTYVLGMPAATSFFYPNYTSIHRVRAARTGERNLVTVNETAHLRGTGLPTGLHD
jgi:probable phosphoglycerate mutase